MIKNRKDKEERLEFIKLEKNDLIKIYALLEGYYTEAVEKKPDQYNHFEFTIDDYQMESIEDLIAFEDKFCGSLYIKLHTDEGVNVRLNSWGNSSLSLFWSDENLISSGLAGKIEDLLRSKKKKFIGFIDSIYGRSFLSILLFGAILSNTDLDLDVSNLNDIMFLSGTVALTSVVISLCVWPIRSKLSLEVNFKQKPSSVFKTHSAEIKIGLITAVASSILTFVITLLIQNH